MNTFQKHFRSFSATERRLIKQEILKQTGMPDATFYSKSKKVERFRKLEREVITQIVNQYRPELTELNLFGN